MVVESLDTTTGAASDVATATAGSDGSFSADVPVGFGDSVITVSATASGNRTGYAQTTVTSDAINGTTALDVTDPAGDDNGPGTYAYPTSDNFHAGAFDLTRFQVVSDGTTVFLRATLANLDPTFGSALGAQLLDVFVHQPGGGRDVHRGAVPEPELLDRAGQRLAAVRRGAGLRVAGVAERRWQLGGHGVRGRVAGQQDDHDRAAAG